MKVLVTGCAGFIGMHVAQALLTRGAEVVGVDALTPYYDTRLKEARLAQLAPLPGFRFYREDIARPETLARWQAEHADITHIVHLAAQPGVRYSLEHPFTYTEANITGHLAVLEYARHLPGLRHLVYASSSSVYGANTTLPFRESDAVDHPVSLYAATKRAGELMSYTYSHLYGIPATGLRFFTVYGPWGRPDMGLWTFTRALYAGETIELYNHGAMRRDFTFIDDIVAGVIAALDHPPTDTPAHRVFNLGNHRSEALPEVIRLLEAATGKQAKLEYSPIQPGDVKDTFADITLAQTELGFTPRTSIAEGIPKFVEWYQGWVEGDKKVAN
jgi:UDP-glucuronate 4-epimerase